MQLSSTAGGICNQDITLMAKTSHNLEQAEQLDLSNKSASFMYGTTDPQQLRPFLGRDSQD
ncbi:MAG: hypothetical protein ACREAI_01955, partial [Nitrososphaera sp.]